MFGYAISLGLPPPSDSAFALDPEIKSERIWAGAVYRPAATLIDRTGAVIKARGEEGWTINAFDGLSPLAVH